MCIRDSGFYYDVDFGEEFVSEADLPKIEAEMKKIVKKCYPMERFVLPRGEAIKFMQEKEEPYKVELIEDLPEDEEISFFRQGDFTDPVSYTHLDVYKRQPLSCPCGWRRYLPGG